MRRLALTVAAVMVTSLAVGGGAAPASADTTNDVLAARYAPVLLFHGSETYYPGTPGIFAQQSGLKFAKDGAGDTTIVNAPAVARLGGHGSGPYSYRYKGTTYNTLQKTRPYASGHQGPMSRSEGFYLDHTGSRAGTKQTTANGYYTGAPIFYDVLPNSSTTREIIYWVFYPWNEAADYTTNSGPYDHEGDWEALGVLINSSNQAYGVNYYAHGCVYGELWKDVSRSGTHALAYVAQGSHGLYPYKNPNQTRADRCDGENALARDFVNDSGLRWLTYNNRMLHVRDQAWYGFGGAWGVPRSARGFKLEDVSTHASGPLGPSRYKLRP